MPNELNRGTHRIGDFYDAYADTPEVKVTLERSDADISVAVAWSNPEVPYASWFMDRDILPTSKNSQNAPKPAPKRVLFHDSYGFVLLIHCRARGYHANMWGPGSGTLRASVAIMGVEEDREFDRPHGVQSEISGLREWLAITSWEEERERRADDWGMVIRSVRIPALKVVVRTGISLEFEANWEWVPAQGRDTVVLHDHLRCTTHSTEARSWEDHMQFHRAVRDLLVISRWRAESCVPVHALREDDPLKTLNGTIHGPQWRSVVVPDDRREPAPAGYHPHLIEYADLGVDGIGRWIELRDTFSRALDPIITSNDLRQATPHTRLAHTGPGVEALGYLLMRRDGKSETSAAKATLQQRLARILSSLADCLPFDGDEWVDNTVAAYNAVKHANRSLPDDVDLMNAWADSVMVVRAWVALELGVGSETVKERLVSDRQSRNFTKIA